MAFSIVIECINMLQRRRRKPVHLSNPYGPEDMAERDGSRSA
jgi:hypothetical protein